MLAWQRAQTIRVATLSKGYDLEYIWKQVDRGPAKDAASYYIQASWFGHVEDLRKPVLS